MKDYPNVPVFKVGHEKNGVVDLSPEMVLGKADVVDGIITIQLFPNSSMERFLELGDLKLFYLNAQIGNVTPENVDKRNDILAEMEK